MNNEENLSRPFTKEETIDNLLEGIQVKKRYTDHTDGSNIAYIVLRCIDGGYGDIPSFDLNAVLESGVEDIAGKLCSLLLSSDDELERMELKGIVLPIERDFIKRIKSLIESFNQGRIEKSENLILEILKVIDFGINGIKFEMKAIGHQDDIDECIDEGENYYPLEGINIAGSLAERYEQLYVSENKDNVINRRDYGGDER